MKYTKMQIAVSIGYDEHSLQGVSCAAIGNFFGNCHDVFSEDTTVVTAFRSI
jgi:hypothetical protein